MHTKSWPPSWAWSTFMKQHGPAGEKVPHGMQQKLGQYYLGDLNRTGLNDGSSNPDNREGGGPKVEPDGGNNKLSLICPGSWKNTVSQTSSECLHTVLYVPAISPSLAAAFPFSSLSSLLWDLLPEWNCNLPDGFEHLSLTLLLWKNPVWKCSCQIQFAVIQYCPATLLGRTHPRQWNSHCSFIYVNLRAESNVHCWTWCNYHTWFQPSKIFMWFICLKGPLCPN